jgi:replicative superfamily II helicase
MEPGQKFWGLPSSIQSYYQDHCNVQKPYEWQLDCLNNERVLSGTNFVFSQPTSGGKSFVAEILLLREVFLRKKIAVMVLPFVSIVQEKMHHLRNLAADCNLVVEGYYGSNGTIPLAEGSMLVVATIEKANAILNSLLDENRLQSLGLVVVDELQLVAEPRRGGILEVMLSKTLAFSSTTQIVGMSATMPNIAEIASWLKAESYIGKFRPVELQEHYVAECTVQAKDGSSRKLVPMSSDDKECIARLVVETGLDKHNVLCFCSSKKGCVATAHLLAKHIRPPAATSQLFEQRQQVLSELRALSNRVDLDLERLIPYGVAFHHAGLSSDEREIIEAAYRRKVLSVLTATSTLAAGVNLPARRVIIRSPYTGMEPLTVGKYRQMIGRAGRAGIDTEGTSFLVCASKQEKCIGLALFNGVLESVRSTLTSDKETENLTRIILDIVCIRRACLSDIAQVVASTLLAIQDVEHLHRAIQASMSTLRTNGFIVSKEGTATLNPQYEPTTLGMATFRSSFSVEQALEVHEELQRAQLGLVLSDELHLLYLVTPMFSSLWLTAEQWTLYLKMLQKFEPSRLRVAEFVGVTERSLHFKAVEKTPSRDSKKVRWVIAHSCPKVEIGCSNVCAGPSGSSVFPRDGPF